MVSCKKYIDEDCFDAAMKCYESTKQLANNLILASESSIPSFVEDSTKYLSDFMDSLNTVELYYELNPDKDRVLQIGKE